MRILKKCTGSSLLEVAMALAISSILITTAYKLYRYVSSSTLREKQKAELQRDIITVSNIIESDIRMAGCGLPGNGVEAELYNNASDRLSLFVNENRYQTVLAQQSDNGHTWVFISDTTGFKSGGWVCMACPTADTIYRYIFHVGVDNFGDDTLILPVAVSGGSYPIATTSVYPATRMRYKVNIGASTELVRLKNNQSFNLGVKLDSINVIPKDIAGNILGAGSLANTAVLTIVIGGYIGKDSKRVFLADSVEINIRNGG